MGYRHTLIILLLFLSAAVTAQKKADIYSYTILVLGKNNQPLYDAKVASRSGELRTNEQGEIQYENYLTYVTVSAVGYSPQKVDLLKYPQGSIVTVILSERKDELTRLRVYVTDKNKDPIPNARVTVTPGISGPTDAGGLSIAEHKEQPGEYVTVRVMAAGYKTQQQKIMVGVAQGNAITKPDDVVRFTMEKGENDLNVQKIIVEVTDEDSNEPVRGASVQLELFGYNEKYSSISDSRGEAALENKEDGFEGTAGRVKVTHRDYQEKWSDIPEDLMTAKESSVRRFVVFVKKKDNNDIAGKYDITWTDPYATYIFQWNVSPSGTGYRVWHKLISTTHGFNQNLVGQSWEDITLTPKGNGTFELMRTSTDANPRNPGFFMQTATCKVGRGGITCEGTHKGSQITHWIKVKGSKLRE